MNDRLLMCIVGLMAAFAALAECSPRFNSIPQALAEFSTNSAACRQRAFEYVRSAVAAESKSIKLRDGFNALRRMASELKADMMYEEDCRKAMVSDNEGRRFAGAVALCNAAVAGWESRRLVESLKTIMSHGDFVSDQHRVTLIRLMADVYSVGLGSAEEALAFLDEQSHGAETNLVLKAGCLGKSLLVMQTAQRMDEAERMADRLMSLQGCPGEDFYAASCLKANIASREGRIQDAERLLLTALKYDNQVPVGISRQLENANVSTTGLATAVNILRSKIDALPLNNTSALRMRIERVQPEVINLLCQQGRFDEALGECRVMLLFASAKNYASAVNMTADVLRRRDGNLGRALAFLEFQQRGKAATPSTDRNVIFAVPQLSDKWRTKGRNDMAATKPENWSMMLAVSCRLLWLDAPVESVAAAKRAFAMAPLASASLQPCADAIMTPFAVATRDSHLVRRIADYLLYGPTGRDGKAGTDDDAGDPLHEFMGALALPKSK